MNMQLHHGWQSNQGSDGSIAHRMLRLLFLNYPGSFLIRLWDGSQLRIGEAPAVFTLGLNQPWVLRDLILFRDPVRLAEAYFNGALEVEGDFNAGMNLRYHVERLHLTLRQKIWLAYHALTLGFKKVSRLAPAISVSRQQRQNNVESIAFHYDVSNDFYRLWLDERMLYSCAYFETAEQSLEVAQCNKLDLICRKLRLRPGESLLDIGCGWGALVCWAAKHYGVQAHGITLSRNQYQFACAEVERQGLQGQVTIEMRNYRDLLPVATYDKISSIGMFEHVGLKNLPGYFAIVRLVLKPNGLFLNHGITSDEPDWNSGVSTRFINRYVFPDGELDTISNIQQTMEEAKFEIFDVEGLRPHYALTLRHWVRRLEEKHDEVVNLVGERTYRIWRLYMTGCALQFEQGSTGIYQILAVRKEAGLPKLPLTRRDLYQTTLN
jgi:cyclopropane-fatty-acyl-phospholipid synthase